MLLSAFAAASSDDADAPCADPASAPRVVSTVAPECLPVGVLEDTVGETFKRNPHETLGTLFGHLVGDLGEICRNPENSFRLTDILRNLEESSATLRNPQEI